MKYLTCTTVEGAILWPKVERLASTELMLHLILKEDLVLDVIELEMTKRGVALPENIDPQCLRDLSPRNIINSWDNVMRARNNLVEGLCGKFVPPPNRLLYEWLSDADGYTNGRNLEAELTEVVNFSGRPSLAPWAKYILRHICFSYNLSLQNIGALWVCFYTLIMGREISFSNFLSDNSIMDNIMSLFKVDNQLKTNGFIKRMRKKTKNGFQIYNYFSADDSKHFDENRTVFIVSDFKEVQEGDYVSVPFEPTFCLVSTVPNQVKSQAYKTNADALIDTIGIEGAAMLNGGCNDNANDAIRNVPDTVGEIQTRVDLHEDENIRKLNYVNGVRRRPIVMGDPYHIGNLAVMHASKGMAGDTVNADHRQIHHRQCLMTMHSLHSDDRAFSQAMMDRVMGNGRRVRLMTRRERQQRWLVNQKYARWVVSLLNVKN